MSGRQRIGSSVLTAALLLGCVLLSLRPVGAVERGLGVLTAPFSALAKITWPLSAWSSKVSAGDVTESEAVAVGMAQRELSERFLTELYASALPEQLHLLEGRRRIPAAVVARPTKDRDVLVLEPWVYEGLEVGLPVVQRDAYVGRIQAIDTSSDPPRVLVELITGAETFVGAEVLPPPKVLVLGRPQDRIPLVVGGLAVESGAASRRDRRTWLAAHNPARRTGWFVDRPLGGEVVVRELDISGDRFGALADGYRLGSIEAGMRDEQWRVDPVLDFLEGLFHVVILAPDDGGQSSVPPAPEHPLLERSWVRALAYTPGDPSPWRETLVVDVGATSGLKPGAACVRGARLVGRLESVGPASSKVSGLGDPGLVVSAAGLLLDHPELPPRVLGRLVSLGRDRETGAVRMRWRAVVPLEAVGGATELRVALFTGSGQPGLPAGLWIGEAWIPTGRSGDGTFEFPLAKSVDAFADSREVWLRMPHRLAPDPLDPEERP